MFSVSVAGRPDVAHRQFAGRDGAGLVEHDRVDPVAVLQDVGAVHEQSECRAAAAGDEQRDGRGEPERAGARDDQHGDARENAPFGLSGGDPAERRERRDGDHDRNEDRRDAVGEALDLGLGGLRVFDELDQMGQRGVRTDGGRAGAQRAVEVDACRRRRSLRRPS